MNILIVDDDIMVSSVVEYILNQLGHTTRIAHSISHIDYTDIDLVFMDAHLPDGSGVAAAKDSPVPVIFISGALDVYNLRCMWEIGCVINKPLGEHSAVQIGRIVGLVKGAK